MSQKRKKTDNLADLPSVPMYLKEIDRLNHEPGFIEFRSKNQKFYLWAFTIGIIVNILIFLLISTDNETQRSKDVFLLMTGSILIYLINHVIALFRSNLTAHKQHLIAGFYIATLQYTLFNVFSGAEASHFWYGLFIILFVWFLILPYSYRELIFHGLLFIVILLCGILFMTSKTFDSHEFFKIVLFYFTSLLAGGIVSITRNRSDAINYKAQLIIQKANEKLEQNQQLINSILSNAPMILWNIDLNGRITYMQGKTLLKFNKEPEEYIGKTIFELFPGREVEDFIYQILKDQKQDGIIQVGPVIFDTRVSPLINKEGNKIGYIGVSMDITDRIKTDDRMNKFRLILDQAPGAVFIMDKDSNFEYINPYFTKISGYTEEDLLHKNIKDTLYKGIDGFVPESRQEVMRSLSEGKSWQGELLTYHKNGSSYWANTIAAPYKNTKGQIEGYIVIQQDVTEKKNVEKALRESEGLYRTLIEKSMEGIVLTRDAEILMANDTFCNIFGYTQEELRNIATTDLIAPEDRERVVDLHYKRMRGELGSISYSAKMLHKNGSVKICEINASTVLIDGLNTSFITMSDVTDRLIIENALRESENKYKTLIENSRDGIIIVRYNRILFANDTFCKMVKYSCDELYSRPSTDFIHPGDHQKALQVSELRKTGDKSTITQDYRMLVKDGGIIECETYSTMIDYEGIPASFYTIHNVTESRRMEEALRESEAKYRELVETTNSIILKWDKDFKVTFLNEYGLHFFGFTREEIFGQPVVGTIIPPTEDNTGRNLRAMVDDIFRDPGKYEQNINENMKKSGERVWISWNNTAIKDEQGHIVNMYSVGTDITERRKNEEELRVTKEKLQLLNQNLEEQVNDTVKKLTEANTQLIRLQKENLQSQFEVLRQQVNPHFLFNSLNVLTSLIKLEPDLAEKFTEHLSKVYRYVLENKDNDLVSLSTELDFLDAYQFLLNIRFMDKIKIDIEIDDDKKEHLILPLALQLIIENAIKHNSMSKKAPLFIKLFIDENLMLNVTNNLQERESSMISTGVGLNNIRHRYELLELPAPEFFKTDTHFIARIPLKAKEN